MNTIMQVLLKYYHAAFLKMSKAECCCCLSRLSSFPSQSYHASLSTSNSYCAACSHSRHLNSLPIAASIQSSTCNKSDEIQFERVECGYTYTESGVRGVGSCLQCCQRLSLERREEVYSLLLLYQSLRLVLLSQSSALIESHRT